MNDIANPSFRRRLARNQGLGPEPGNQCANDDSRAKANSGPMERSQHRIDHSVLLHLRRRFLLSSNIVSNCFRSSLAIGSPSALLSRVGVASIALPTEITA